MAENLAKYGKTNPRTKEVYYEPHSRQEEEDDAIRLILVGLTGNGKSSSANTIFTTEETKEQVFPVSMHGQSKTGAADVVTKTIRGRKITIVDTPGTQHGIIKPGDVAKELYTIIKEEECGFDAFLVTQKFRDEGINEDERESLRVLQNIFENGKKDFFLYVIFLFTHGDLFERYKQKKSTDKEECLEFEDEIFRDMFSTTKKNAVGPIVKKAKGGVILFNNNDELENKIKMSEALVERVDKLRQRNNNERYSNSNLPPEKGCLLL